MGLPLTMDIREELNRLFEDVLQARNSCIKTMAEAIDDNTLAKAQEVGKQLLLGEPDEMEGRKAAEWIARCLTQIDYIVGQDPRETLKGAGYIMLPSSCIQALHGFNASKKAFENYVTGLSTLDGLKNVHRRNTKVQKVLSRAGGGVLSLRQVYRRILIIEKPISKLSWYWSSRPSTVALSRADALELLTDLDKHKASNSEYNFQDDIMRVEHLGKDNAIVQVKQENTNSLRVRLGFLNASDSWLVKDPAPLVTGPMPVVLLDELPEPLIEFPSNQNDIKFKKEYVRGNKSARYSLISAKAQLHAVLKSDPRVALRMHSPKGRPSQ